MEKLILKDGTVIQFSYAFTLDEIMYVDKTLEELEEILTSDNLSDVKLATPEGNIYGKYKNLQLRTITKNYLNNTISIGLQETR